MATISENRNTEETLPDESPALRRVLSSGIIGLTNGITYNPSEANKSPLAPNYLSFPTTGVSNGLASKINGINDFTAYNPYIHHMIVGDLGAGSIETTLNGAGINNFSSSSAGTQINIMNNIVLASNRFELYSRQFRG